MVENERFFWSATALQCKRMRAKCKANALCCRMPAECKANARQPRQDSWESCEWHNKNETCSFLSAIARFRADSGECEANAWQTRDEPAKSAFLTAFFKSPRSQRTNLC